MIRKRSFQELQEDSIRYLTNNTDITQLSPGGVARSIVDITNQHIAEFYDTLDTDVSMAFVSTARGFFLDLIGKLFGLSRIQKENTEVLASDKIIKFFTNSPGTSLAKFLPSRTIPQGTQITNADSTLIYTTTAEAPFSSTALEVFVSARSQNIGPDSNAGVGVLNTHNLGTSSVGVTNIAPIFLGRDIEEDDAFRNRIAANATAAETANETAVRLAVLSAPGVADIEMQPFLRGSGTFDLFVIPEGNRVPQRTLDIINSRVAAVAAYGISFTVREPDYIPVKLEGTARFNTNVLDGEKEFLLTQAEQSLLAYMGDIRPGGEFIVNQARSIILDTDPGIIDADVVFLCVDGKAQIIRNFNIQDDELLIPDETVADPVVVRQQ